MAYIRVITNLYMDDHFQEELVKDISKLVGKRLGKSEDHVVVAFHANSVMCFAGSTEPAIMLDIKSLEMNAEDTTPLANAIANLLEARLRIAKTRIWAIFGGVDASKWSWNHDFL